MAKKESTGKSNPFHRDREKNFAAPGGIRSGHGSAFDYGTRGGNVMEDELGRLSGANRGATFGKKGGK